MRFNPVAAILLILIGLFMLPSNLGSMHLNLPRLFLTWSTGGAVGAGTAALFGRRK